MKAINAAGMTEKSWTEAPTLFFKFAGTPNSSEGANWHGTRVGQKHWEQDLRVRKE
jgi:hypothetical protein